MKRIWHVAKETKSGTGVLLTIINEHGAPETFTTAFMTKEKALLLGKALLALCDDKKGGKNA